LASLFVVLGSTRGGIVGFGESLFATCAVAENARQSVDIIKIDLIMVVFLEI
jgi:hypothetical protein